MSKLKFRIRNLALSIKPFSRYHATYCLYSARYKFLVQTDQRPNPDSRSHLQQSGNQRTFHEYFMIIILETRRKKIRQGRQTFWITFKLENRSLYSSRYKCFLFPTNTYFFTIYTLSWPIKGDALGLLNFQRVKAALWYWPRAPGVPWSGPLY